MAHALVDSLDQVRDNVVRYEREVRGSPELMARTTRFHVWCALESAGGTWSFAPAKFVGYAKTTAADYLTDARNRDGGRAEKVLKKWFETVPPGTPQHKQLDPALRKFIVSLSLEYSGPRKGARICVPRQGIACGGAAAISPARPLHDRIHVDAAICGGRPHIRGTRVRVCDILDLLAGGAAPSDVLADYPYLTEADLRAALGFAAAASRHRIVLAA